MNQIWPIGTEIWFRTDKKCGRTDGRKDGRNGRTDGRTHGRRQNYIPPTSSGDNKLMANTWAKYMANMLLAKYMANSYRWDKYMANSYRWAKYMANSYRWAKYMANRWAKSMANRWAKCMHALIVTYFQSRSNWKLYRYMYQRKYFFCVTKIPALTKSESVIDTILGYMEQP